jgi:hypothetical protein
MFAYIGVMWFLSTPDAAVVTTMGINLGAVICLAIGLSTMILDILARFARNRRA